MHKLPMVIKHQIWHQKRSDPHKSGLVALGYSITGFCKASLQKCQKVKVIYWVAKSESSGLWQSSLVSDKGLEFVLIVCDRDKSHTSPKQWLRVQVRCLWPPKSYFSVQIGWGESKIKDHIEHKRCQYCGRYLLVVSFVNDCRQYKKIRGYKTHHTLP